MAETDKIVVAVRVRPFSNREIKLTAGSKRPGVINMAGNRTDLYGTDGTTGKKPSRKSSSAGAPGAAVRVKEDRSFTYDHSFWSGNPADTHYADQNHVYQSIGVGLLDNAFNGYNACIFAYGQTGSGKTYTMMGPDEEPGLIPRICNEMFLRIDQNTDQNVKYKVECSYMEIYNERVRDLLAMSNRKQNLKVREHKVMGPYVEGLRTFAVSDYRAIEALIGEGTKARVTAATAMNDESSRSHAVFNVVLTESTFDELSGNTGEKQSRICLVDLAGSERVWRTGAEGTRLKEGGSINKSLTTLGLVISHLADIAQGKKVKDHFIPYRDSVLTWLLKENLGGNSKTVMIATVSPSWDSYEETLSTLRYADTAKKIQTFAVVNEDANAKMVRELREEVLRLRAMLSNSGIDGMSVVSDSQMVDLKDRLAESERLMKEMSMSWNEKLRIAHQVLEERARQLKEMGISVQGGGIAVDASKMYLLNLTPDSDDLTMYYLKDTMTKIGSGKDQDVQIRGDGILAAHCVLPVESGQIYAMPLPGASVFIDGELISSKVVVAHGQSITMGVGKEFRVVCPMGRADSGSQSPIEPEPEEGLASSTQWPGSRFHRACELGDMATIVYLLGDPKDSDGASIHTEVLANSEEARWKRAPLMLAADHGHMDVCKLLIGKNADPGKADERGYTPLHACADSGHLDICTLLVESGGHCDPQAKIGCTPLHRAAEQGHLEVCEYLQSKGADVDFQDRGKGWTPLLLAALHGREQVYGRTAFDYAAETTSFVMLHSPLDRLQKREEVCRILFPHLGRKQQGMRSLTERKAIVIAQVPTSVEPGTFRCKMTNFSSKAAGSASAGRPATGSARRPSAGAARRGGPGGAPLAGSPKTARAQKVAEARRAAARPRGGTIPKSSASTRRTISSKGPNLSTGNRSRSSRP
eukprot:gene1872-7943_t